MQPLLKTELVETPQKQRRVFFAVVPGKSTLEKLLKLQAENKDKKARFTPEQNIHLTLLFIGPVSENTLSCIKNTTKEIKQKKFKLQFDKTGVFRKTGILWVGQKEPDENLLDLVDKLKTAAQPCEIKLEKRPYKSHITLARKFFSSQFSKLDEPIDLIVDNFCLIESVPVDRGVRYDILATYSLHS